MSWLLAGLLLLSAAPQFQLRDTAGEIHTTAEWAGHKAIVLFFVTTDCPVSNGYAPEMNRLLQESYAGRGVLVYAVEADPGVSQTDAARHAREYGYRFPVLLDPSQILVRHTGATVTPQAAVLSPGGEVKYLGRIDNRVEDFGKTRPQATGSELREALDAVLAGRPVARPTTKSIGCAIPRRKP